jgi:putative copper resistance protein D
MTLAGWMSDGLVAWIGLGLELGAAMAYARAARKRSPRGNCWPAARTAAFLGGLLVIALALDSGLAAHDDVPSMHMLQHALLMMLAPMLLALGAPLTLAMRTMQPAGRGKLRALLHDPSVRGLLTRPGVLFADYNVTMAVLLIAPVYRLAERVPALHVAIHGYLVACGLLFWTAILARDPVPVRLPRPQRARAAGLCIPVNLALAGAVALAPGAFINADHHEALLAAAVLAAAATTTSIMGMGFVSAGRRSGVARRAAGPRTIVA